MEDSIFTKIIKGEIPCHKVYEDDRVIAFLTINPVAEGHTLVIPKKQINQLWDLESEDYVYLLDVTKKIALHLRQVMKVDRVGVVVKGFEVPHVHIHLIPVNEGSNVIFDHTVPPDSPSNDELAAIAERIRF
ncbi:MAG: HIT family protein [Candidatus Saccharimonadales bacterium]